MNILINAAWQKDEYSNKFALETFNKYFCKGIYLSKIFEYILISDNLAKTVFDYVGDFFKSLLFKTNIELFWTNNKHF